MEEKLKRVKLRCDAMRCDANIMVALKKKIFSKYTKYLGQTIVIKRLCQEKLEIYEKFLSLRQADEKRLHSCIAFY